MKILVYSKVNKDTIHEFLGSPEYSYYFVLRDYLPMLERVGEVIVVKCPEEEVDNIYRSCIAKGEACVFLSFSAPHHTITGLECPTIPVFAWEYNTIPFQYWEGDTHHDWRAILSEVGSAITLCTYTVDSVKSALGENFPIVSVPSPVWDKMMKITGGVAPPIPARKQYSLTFDGVLIDSANQNLFLEVPVPNDEEEEEVVLPIKNLRYRIGATRRHVEQWYADVVEDLLPSLITSLLKRLGYFLSGVSQALLGKNTQNEDVLEEKKVLEKWPWIVADNQILFLSGIVYVSVFNPNDGRKCWESMLTAFCAAFRDNEDVTLVVKASHLNIKDFSTLFLEYLRKLHPFSCRIVVMQAYLSDKDFVKLLRGASYYVNTSSAEGQCLPLMEYMCCGVPAIAPCSTAMADYVDDSSTFVVSSHVEATAWQHDPRKSYRTLHQMVDWVSLVQAYKESYRVATEDEDRYLAMGAAAVEKMAAHCSADILQGRLSMFLKARSSVVESIDVGEPE